MARSKAFKEAVWKDTTSVVELKASEEQAGILLKWLAASKYAWNWAIAEWQREEMNTMMGLRKGWPTVEEIVSLWRDTDGRIYSDVPTCVPEMSILKFASSHIFTRACAKPAPTSTKPGLSGSFRLDKSMCMLSKDRTKFSINGVGDFEVSNIPEAFSWDKVLYVTVRKYIRKGYDLYLIKGTPSYSESEAGATYQKMLESLGRDRHNYDEWWNETDA